MTSPTAPLAVVVCGKEGLLLGPTSRAVAAFRGIPAPDATRAVRRARGILAEDLDPPRAAELVRLLAAEGIAARAIPAALLAPPPPPLLLSRAEPGPAGLRAEYPGGTMDLPWGRFRLVAVAPFMETVFTTKVEDAPPTPGDIALHATLSTAGALAGIPFHFGMPARKVERQVPKSEFRLYLDLLLEGPAERFRVDSENFDFSGLGARKEHAVHRNFRTLFEIVTGSAPTAATSPGADLLAAGGRLSSLGYQSVDEFDRELRWLSTVVA